MLFGLIFFLPYPGAGHPFDGGLGFPSVYMNKTQMEIAEEIGISQAQVSRLEKGALLRMRAKI